jgi:CRP-like cAMP-binding protein
VLQPHLKFVELPQEMVLFEMGGNIDRVYFPHSGIISLVVDLASGEMIEVAMVGRESLAGSSSALDGSISLNKAVVQIAGAGSMIDSHRLRSLADASTFFRATLVRHEQLITLQAQQSAACNATHTLEARLSRRLLRCRDLQAGDDDLPLTQEFLAEMLGARRTSVSVIANTLQQAGFIRYRRGHIRILDVDGLRESACECYETVRSNAARLLEPQPRS